MSDDPIVIVGASHAGVGLALQLRREGWQGGIQLVGEESYLPYHRPPLSKEFLAGSRGEEQILLRPQKIYEDNRIELRLGSRVERLDCEKKSLQLENGGELSYRSLALCTGAVTHRLPIGRDLAGVHYIRHMEQVLSLRNSLTRDGHTVIIGGGYIGLETAAALGGLGQRVTVIEMEDRVLKRVTSEVVSEYITSLHEARGVRIVTGTAVTGLEGKGKVTAVTTERAGEFRADTVIIGVGVAPNIGLAQAAGIHCDNGIVVDEYCRTSMDDVYAAGDCTSHPSSLYGTMVRLESVQNANDQSRVAAANMAGKEKRYDALPWFWSDQYQVKLQMAGLNSEHDQQVLRGKPDLTSEEGFSMFYLKKGRLIAVDCINRPQDFMASKSLIMKGATPDPSRLKDSGVALKDLLGAD